MPHIDFPLYLITDRTQTGGRPMIPLLRQAIDAGVRAIQVREKDLEAAALIELAEKIFTILREVDGHLFINDRVDVAMALGSLGIHLRSDSLPVPVARTLAGPDRLIGVSAHTVDDVVEAEVEGADFVVLGPIYETPSKRTFGAPIGLRPLEQAAARCSLPLFAIGGITASRVHDVRRAGAFGVAVISSILGAADVEAATRAFVEAVTVPL
jgi:thiamine-phosphate pyrophosphorylase